MLQVLWMVCEVASSVRDVLLHEAARHHPHEACGLLFGTVARIDRAITCANVHRDPARHFEIDPAALLAAHKAERAGGPAVAGYWHSHPAGPAAPSATDRACASGDGHIWAIVARGEIALWRDSPGGFEALSYAVIDG